jgi:predicted ArsR family transcriptional regulator
LWNSLWQFSVAGMVQHPVRRIDDPEVLKGIAQPFRQRLWRYLLRQGPATVGTMAKHLDADPGQVSYHLRELAKGGWVEHAPELARDRRESWWRAVPGSSSFAIDDFATPEGRAIARHLDRQLARENFERLAHFANNVERWSPQWRAATNATQSFLYLTAAEARAMNTELNEVLGRWARADDEARERGDTTPRQPYLHLMYGFPEEAEQT